LKVQEDAQQELAAAEAVGAADAEQQDDLQKQRVAAEQRCTEIKVGGGAAPNMRRPQ
jgi:hypothetical protein